jgi:hypothetical protein
LAEAKGGDEDAIRVAQAAKIGYFLRKFRLRGKKNTSGHMAYDRAATIACLSAHLPQNPPNSPESPSMNFREMQAAETNTSLEGTEATEGFGSQSAQGDKANHVAVGGCGVDSGDAPSAVALAVLPAGEMVEGVI